MLGKSKTVDKSISEILKQVKKIASKHVDKKSIIIEKDVLTCPIGCLYLFKNKWLFALDYSWKEDVYDSFFTVDNMMSISYFIRDLSLIIPDVEFNYGYYLVFNNEGEFCDSLFNSDIIDYMQENKVFYSVARTILEREIIEKNREKSVK
jgi:hypothetical protein